jgi:hydroxyethylthiazole kinase-like uncharacterized protein yjeF
MMALQICYPKPTSKPLYDGLVTQCKSLQLPFVPVEAVCSPADGNLAKVDVIVDAMFGFSFKPPLRPPFDEVLAATVEASASCFVASVDIPSGWHVEEGDIAGIGLAPDMLISLTAPKLAARHFKVGAQASSLQLPWGQQWCCEVYR